MQPDNIPISELLDEAWHLYFHIVKGMLLAVVWALHICAMVLLRVAQEFHHAAFHLRRFVEEWQPVKPLVFEYRGQPWLKP